MIGQTNRNYNFIQRINILLICNSSVAYDMCSVKKSIQGNYMQKVTKYCRKKNMVLTIIQSKNVKN